MMGYKKSKHYNAVLKYMKEKEVALKKDVADIMNGSVDTAVKQLEQEGKIKCEKIKVRFQNGNLNNSWALYLTGIDYNKVIEFERGLVNKPFESPLKEHHCYKKDKTESNVIDMQDYIKVKDQEIILKEYEGQRVVTFKDIDDLHQRVEGTASRNFRQNRNKFINGVDYFELESEELARLKRTTNFVASYSKKFILLTETGYLMLVKSFSDDLAWTVQRELVNTYFKVKQLKQDPEVANVPQVKNMQTLDIMEMMIQEMKKQNDRIERLENVIGGFSNVLNK